MHILIASLARSNPASLGPLHGPSTQLEIVTDLQIWNEVQIKGLFPIISRWDIAM